MVVGKFQPTFGSVDFEGEPIPEKIYNAAVQMAKKDVMPGFTVSIEQSLYIGKFEVTQEQWQKVMGENPSIFKGEKNPVENVGWNDVQVFLNKLNQLDKDRYYRLPTEFEWEYAARAGATTDISWDDIARFGDSCRYCSVKVGTMKPNINRLYMTC